MVIKSLSRKFSPTGIRRLCEYVSKGATGDPLVYNLRSDPTDLPSIVSELTEHDSQLKRRANGIHFYHDIISFQGDIPEYVVHDLMQDYFRLKTKNQLSFGRIHRSDNTTHVHLYVSAGDLLQNKRQWMSKAQFRALKQSIERSQIQKYPELLKTSVCQTVPSKSRAVKRSRNECEAKRRLKSWKPTERDRISMQVQEALTVTSKSKAEQVLNGYGLRFYQRSGSARLTGVVDRTGTKYRFKTLELDSLFLKMSRLWMTHGKAIGHSKRIPELKSIEALHPSDFYAKAQKTVSESFRAKSRIECLDTLLKGQLKLIEKDGVIAGVSCLKSGQKALFNDLGIEDQFLLAVQKWQSSKSRKHKTITERNISRIGR